MSSTTKTLPKDAKPLPLNEILRDLAYTRVSDLDLSSLVPQSDLARPQSEVDKSVAQSYEFVKEAKAALKIQNRELTGVEGGKLEEIRSKLEETMGAMGLA